MKPFHCLLLASHHSVQAGALIYQCAPLISIGGGGSVKAVSPDLQYCRNVMVGQYCF